MSQEVRRGPLSRRKDKPLPRMEGDSKDTFRLPHPRSGRAATPLGSRNSLGTYPYAGDSTATKPRVRVLHARPSGARPKGLQLRTQDDAKDGAGTAALRASSTGCFG